MPEQFLGGLRYNINQAVQPTFKMMFPKYDELNFFIIETDLPGLSMGGVDMPYRNNATNVPSNRIEYDLLNVQVLMDEDWVIFERMKQLMEDISFGSPPVFDETLDCELHVLDGNYKGVIGLKFESAYPTMMSSVPLMIQNTDANPVQFSMTWRYQFYDIVRRGKA